MFLFFFPISVNYQTHIGGSKNQPLYSLLFSQCVLSCRWKKYRIGTARCATYTEQTTTDLRWHLVLWRKLHRNRKTAAFCQNRGELKLWYFWSQVHGLRRCLGSSPTGYIAFWWVI